MRQRIAALGSVGIAAILGLLLLWGGIDGKRLSAMEKMAANVRQAKSYKCVRSGKSWNLEDAGMRRALNEETTTEYWLASGCTRWDTRFMTGKWAVETTTICPADNTPWILIDHTEKTFCRYPARVSGDYRVAAYKLEDLGKFAGKAGREFGVKTIDGREARGFEIKIKNIDPDFLPGAMEIWIDAESSLPVIVQYEMKLGEAGRAGKICISERISDIQWNIGLDPKLFDPTPPQGYKEAAEKPRDVAEQVRQITKALRIYAEASGGFYPRVKTFVLWGVVFDDLCKKLGLADWPTQEDIKKGGNPAKAANARKGLSQIDWIQKKNPDAAYYGKTVGPKDKDKVLLRWKLDDGRYEVILGDLRNETVTAEKLRALEGK